MVSNLMGLQSKTGKNPGFFLLFVGGEREVEGQMLPGQLIQFSRLGQVSQRLKGCQGLGGGFVQNPAVGRRGDAGVFLGQHQQHGLGDVQIGASIPSFQYLPRVEYMAFNVGGMSRASLKDCKASNVYGAGAFVYDKSASIEFVRCEAARCYYGERGDGFNGHSANTGDPFSKQTTALLVDCWAHDNADDGYSDHERSETTIIGGLYEYNGKAGVTPAGGSHCTCYNVISRKNYRGFLYTNSAVAEEGGKGGQMMCIGCVADNNNRDASTQVGFAVSGAGNSALLINCKSIGHRVGYLCGETSGMRLVDCGSLNDTAVKSGSNIVVENTALVT